MGTGPSTLQPLQQDDGNSSPTAMDETTWMPDNKSDFCLVCGEAFTLFNRRHHCRHCQKLVCSACSSRKWRFDSGVSGRAGPQRVCKDCFLILVAEQKQVLIGRDAASLESGEFVHFKVVLHEIVGKIIIKADKETPPQDLEGSGDVDKVLSGTGSSNIFCSPTPPRRDDPQREETTMKPSSDVPKLARAPHCRLTVAGKEVGKTNPVEAEQNEDAAAERCSFNEAFFFRVSCGSRNADYIVLEVFDGGNLLGRCRVPIFRTPRDMDGIFWHVLLKVDGAPRAVGRVLVAVRNLGAGSIRRSAWDHGIPGGCQVTAPTDLTPPPDNPLLETFFRRDSEMHNALFFRFGEEDEEFLPFNERTLEILPRVRICPLVHHTSDDTAGPMSYNNGSEGGWDKDVRNTSRARVDSWNSMESSVSDTLPGGLEGSNPSVSASRVRAGWRGGTSEGVSPSSAGWSDSWDNSVSLRGEGRSRSFFNRSDVSKMVNGALVLTTHRVLFVGGKRNEARRTLVEMPLAFITKMRIEYRLCKGLIRLQVYCRDRKKVPFVIRKTVNQTWVSVIQSVRRFEEEIEWLTGEDNFAHSSDTRRVKASLDKEGASLALFPDLNSCLDDNPLDVTSEYTRGFPSDYHPAREHVRQGVDKGKDWRQSEINCNFTLCSTYGRHLVVPSAMQPSAVEKAFKARSRHRIPALTWLHPRTRAALCRSSQPILGINPTQSLLDDAHDILKVIQMTTTSPLVSPSRSHSRSTSISGSPISITAESPVVPVENEPWSLRGKAYLSDGTDSLNDLMESSLSTEANNDNVSEKDSERADIRGVPSAEAGLEGDSLQEKPIITEGLFETLEEKEESPLESGAGTVDASETIGGGDSPPAASFIVNSERHPEAGLAGDLEEYEAADNQIGNACGLIKDHEDKGSVAAGDSTRLAQYLIEQRSTSSGGETNQKQPPRIVLVAAPAGAEALAIEEIEEEREPIEVELEGGPEEVDINRVHARKLPSPSLVSTIPSVQGAHLAHSIPNTIVLEVPTAGLAAVLEVANAPPRLSFGPASPSIGGRGNSSTRRVVESGVNTANNASRHPWNRADSESNVIKPGGRRRMPVLRILDGRSMLLAKYHQVRGMGHEDISRLGGERESSISFLGIPNKSGVQKSFAALVEACCLREDDPAWLLHVHNSRWLEHVSVLLKGASIVCTHLEAGDPVLVHCSDGWDRTPQITALAQLMLDPYYRTIRGFQVLVEKDWCGFGHQFATRGGHGHNPESRTAPIFPQFLDATYQLLRQYPESFEFSENLLILLMHAYYSRWFNNLLHDNEHDRVLAYARSSLSKASGGDSTVSLWTHVEFCGERYENVLWNTGQFDLFSDTSPLWPAYGVRHLVFWENAWAGRGLQHPGCGWLKNAGSTMEDALRNLVQKQQSIIKMLRFEREIDGNVTPALGRQKYRGN